MVRPESIATVHVPKLKGAGRGKVRTGSRQGADRVTPVHAPAHVEGRVRDGLVLRVVRKGKTAKKRKPSHGARPA